MIFQTEETTLSMWEVETISMIEKRLPHRAKRAIHILKFHLSLFFSQNCVTYKLLSF